MMINKKPEKKQENQESVIVREKKTRECGQRNS